MLRNQRGQALLLVLVMTTAIFMIGSAAVTLGTAARKNAIRDIWQKKAYYIAEAGIEKALAQLRNDPLWHSKSGKELADDYAGGAIEEVTVKDTDAQNEIGTLVKITSKGRYGKTHKTLEVGVLVTTKADVFKGLSILPENPADVEVTGNFSLERCGEQPRVIINGDINFQSNGGNKKDIDAIVFASGKIDDKHGRVDNKNECFEYDAIPSFPALPSAEWCRNNATQSFMGDIIIGDVSKKCGNNRSIDLNIATLNENGVYFIDGNVSISGTYYVPATIIATGDIFIEDLQRNDRDNGLLLTLIALGSRSGKNGDISAQGGKQYIHAIIVANGFFNANGNKNLFGSIIARGINIDDKVSVKTVVTTDPYLIERSLPEFFKDNSALPEETYPKLKIRSWLEG